MSLTLHVDDTVCFTCSVNNVNDNLDGEDGRVTAVAPTGVHVAIPGAEVFVRDTADITLIDCPHDDQP